MTYTSNKPLMDAPDTVIGVGNKAHGPCAYCAGKGGRYRNVYSRFLGTEAQVHQGPWETCWKCKGTGKA